MANEREQNQDRSEPGKTPGAAETGVTQPREVNVRKTPGKAEGELKTVEENLQGGEANKAKP